MSKANGFFVRFDVSSLATNLTLTLTSLICGLLLFSLSVAFIFKPNITIENRPIPDFEQIIPTQFGEWSMLPNAAQQVDLTVNREGQTSIEQPYDTTLLRTYVNKQGQQIMLAVAYGRNQQQEVKIHRPEVCYIASGFQVKSLIPTYITLQLEQQHQFQIYEMLAFNNQRLEAINYWVRIGGLSAKGAFDARLEIIRQGFRGHVPDGILVRTSMLIDNSAQEKESHKTQRQFINQMMAAVPLKSRKLFLPDITHE